MLKKLSIRLWSERLLFYCMHGFKKERCDHFLSAEPQGCSTVPVTAGSCVMFKGVFVSHFQGIFLHF